MPNREGPTLFVPDPFYVCGGCIYLRAEGTNYVCRNLMSPFVLIGLIDETPAWCPLLPKGPLPEGE